MKRLHLVEIIDQAWCPKAVRDGVQDYLRFLEQTLQIYRRCGARLGRAIKRSHSPAVIDLCSGGGGPWTYLWREINQGNGLKDLPVYLSDIHPNGKAFKKLDGDVQSQLHYCNEPVDATQVPSHLHGFRTLFTAFHHFERPVALKMLKDAVNRRDGIGIFEFNQRHILSLVGTIFIALMNPLAAPFIRPFRWSRLLWTYLIPVIPLACMFDGIVSCFRVYSPIELDDIVSEVASRGYRWEKGVERIGPFPVGVTYLIGYPVEAIELEVVDNEQHEASIVDDFKVVNETVYGSEGLTTI